MANGNLRAYLAKCHPSHQLQLTWFREMASTLSYIHDRRVLVADIASRDFLLDSALSLKICDFSEASFLPSDSDMDGVDENGFITRIDIGLLGVVMHEVVTDEVDLFKDKSPTDGRAHWPEGKFLPSTQDIWLSGIIEGCWDGEYSGVHSLLQALSSVALPPSSAVVQSRITRLLVDIRDTINSRSIATIIGGLGLAAFALVVGEKALLTSWGYRRFL